MSLGIGVKTHSSSIEDAQADRVRRKAEREGLVRDVQPEEPAKAKKGTPKKAAEEPPAEPAPAPAPAPTPEAAPAEPAPVVEAPAEAPAPPAPKPTPPSRLVTSSGSERPASPRRVEERGAPPGRRPPGAAAPAATRPAPA